MMMTPGTDAGTLEGLLVVNKPAGWTSHDVVAKIRRMLGGVKAGHTGTLDPMATGVLPVCVGRATRVAEYLSGADKRYRAVLKLGASTDTDDASGAVIAVRETSALTREEIVGAIEAMTGPAMQTPPMYSAVKIGGERLYRAARRGETVERPSRPIEIFRISVSKVEGDLAAFEADCSKGTYIRALCRDIGERLGVGAHLVQLERTRSGPFGIEEAVTIDRIEEAVKTGKIGDIMIPTTRALPQIPWISVGPEGLRRVSHGASLRHDDAVGRGGDAEPGGLVMILGPDGGLAALARLQPGNIFKMEKVLING